MRHGPYAPIWIAQSVRAVARAQDRRLNGDLLRARARAQSGAVTCELLIGRMHRESCSSTCIYSDTLASCRSRVRVRGTRVSTVASSIGLLLLLLLRLSIGVVTSIANLFPGRVVPLSTGRWRVYTQYGSGAHADTTRMRLITIIAKKVVITNIRKQSTLSADRSNCKF